jgi:hypothetical protein
MAASPTVEALDTIQDASTAVTHTLQTPTDASEQPVSETLMSNDGLLVDDGSEPAQATLSPESVFVPAVEAEKVTSDSEPLAAMTIFNETFEGSFPGTSWTLYGTPTWDDTSYDKHGGSCSGWCGDSSLNPADGYTDNMNAWMVYGPFSLADATSASMSFWYKNLSESNCDYFKWLASVDGTNFFGFQISGNQNSWRSQVFDLTNVYTLGDLRGQSQVWIAFNFTSDGSNSGPAGYAGAYVDDVIITKDSSGGGADLTPYQPSNWNNKLPVGTTQLGINDAHSYSGVYLDNQTLYFNWASINQGTVASGSYTVHVEVTGTGGSNWNWTIPSDAVNEWYGLTTDQAVGPLAAGSHTFKVWVDYNNTVSESNETNNYYERTINVSASLVEYYAECADNSNFISPISSDWTTQEQWTFINLTPGQTYWYRVKAKSGTTESDWSNVEYSQQESSNPGSLQFSAAMYNVNENGGTATITVTRTGGSDGTVGVHYATSNGSATAGSDYTAKSGDLSWSNGDSVSKTFTVSITNDSTYEGNETVNLTLSNPTGGAALGAQSTAVLTIIEAEINLTSGWNMISLSIQPDNTAISNVLNPISGKYSSAWAYQNNGWKVYDPANPGFSDLATMETGWGYWLNMTEAANLTVSGTEPSKSIDLLGGWNLVGYNSSTAQPIADALTSISGKVVSVWAYIDGSWKVYDPANPGFSDLTTMEPGYGYWIATTEACTWTLP